MAKKEMGIRMVFGLLFVAILGSCVSYKALPQDTATNVWSSSIKTGDMVKVILKDGKKIELLKVISINDEYLIGTYMLFKNNQLNPQGATFKLNDIQTLKKGKFSAGRT